MTSKLFEIKKNYLVLIAGILWLFAGVMIMLTGLPIFFQIFNLINLIFSGIVFFIFYWFIFKKLVAKHTNRIRKEKCEKMPFWKFFSLSSYIIMIFMMSGGIILRKFNLIPKSIVGPFYTGLGFALFSCGTRFIYAFFKKRVLEEN